MEERASKIIFTLDGINVKVECFKGDKMKNIYRKFAKLENKNPDQFLFLYEGNKSNFDLSFQELVDSGDMNNTWMNILVYNKENKRIIFPKLKEKVNEIILSNDIIKDDINKVILQIENIIKISKNNQLNYINEILYKVNKNIEKNNGKIKDSLNNNNKNIKEDIDIKGNIQIIK